MKKQGKKKRGSQGVDETLSSIMKQAAEDEAQSVSASTADDGEPDAKRAAVDPTKILRPAREKGKFDEMRERTNQTVLAPHRIAMRAHDDDDDDDGDLFVKSTVQRHADLEAGDDELDLEGKRKNKKRMKKVSTLAAAKKELMDKSEVEHFKFNDDDEAIDEKRRLVGVHLEDGEAARLELLKETGDLDEASQILKQEDTLDKEVQRARLKARKQERKRKRKARDAEADADANSDADDGG